MNRAAASRPLLGRVLVSGGIAATLLSIVALDWDVARFLEGEERALAAGRLAALLGAFVAPDLSRPTLELGLRLSLDTLSIAIWGTLLGAIARIHTPREELTPRQQARLQAFARRYNARTRGSKELTQRYRKVHADPRVVTGFRPALKELVYPIVAARSKGPHLWDVDGNRYIDCLNGFGCNYFGWQPDFVSEAVKRQIDSGIEIGPQSLLAGEVAELFCETTGTERAAFCNTGWKGVPIGCRRPAFSSLVPILRLFRILIRPALY